MGEEDGGFRTILELCLTGIGDHTNDLDRFLSAPTVVQLFSETLLCQEVTLRKSVIDHGDRWGVEIVAVFKVTAGQNRTAHGLEIT